MKNNLVKQILAGALAILCLSAQSPSEIAMSKCTRDHAEKRGYEKKQDCSSCDSNSSCGDAMMNDEDSDEESNANEVLKREKKNAMQMTDQE